ncbi:hypothetical protein LIPSTDRAFT_75723 [Lipomyces starkeyi NRRL Y-11557]|uniref:Uncharacterized protein n=1 Tax=Lipomyces starkeyi NRRL Y-11557 TaxID=675824 RepID=A0A1E3PVQ6_LIPST|nr:hypothetical protein LIPSTDRAFT_75723 [Lipomyces starkeyi NRRL Y-11557]
MLEQLQKAIPLFEKQHPICMGLFIFYHPVDSNCCAVHIVANQPEFKAQKSSIEEAATAPAHLF